MGAAVFTSSFAGEDHLLLIVLNPLSFLLIEVTADAAELLISTVYFYSSFYAY